MSGPSLSFGRETSERHELGTGKDHSVSLTGNGDTSREKHDLNDKQEQDVIIEPDYATGLRLFLIMITINMSGLLTALEIGIIATAIPAITDKFRALDDVGWYGSATFLAVAATSALWGKLFKYLNFKFVYLASIGVFLIGSIVAATAPTSVAVIVGRAIQGLGISGTLNGSIIVINYVSHPRRHPMLIGIWTCVFMISTVLGPIIGGALTSGVSWRWCFYINLPLGGPIVILLLLFLKVPRHIKPTPATWKEITLQLDLPGLSLIVASLVCFILALQWGGQSKTWGNGSVIATLVLWIVLSIMFVIVERLQGERAMIPWRLMKPRATWANVIWSFLGNAALYQIMFYLPIYFQSVKGKSAIMSGVLTLPFLAFFGVGSMLSGTLVGKTRHLQPYQLTCALLMTSGMALTYELDIESSKAWYIGAEVLLGFGVGFGNQIPIMAVQGLSKAEDVPVSTGIMFMTQSGSAAYFVVIAQSIFANRMLETLRTTAPNLNPYQVLGTGATDIIKVYSGVDLDRVLGAYMTGIKDVFTCALAASVLAVLLAFVIPLQRLPEHKESEEKVEEVSAEYGL
ncbi:major facilitator superfamily domain-containing protein [Lophiotrema nucula]|uniref:Major facilitator superfamily domain-containing protein n=1 Tax=Lophiotrema nucula TaxID=690887 RepID=A0A6A5ZSN8_9PLEO|nr:major facilitator superfamily domain-containing protein [Lophiotrema nucula]